jgi:hypothetical protein
MERNVLVIKCNTEHVADGTYRTPRCLESRLRICRIVVRIFYNAVEVIGERSRCPRSLSCGSTATRLLGMRVRIPP